MKLRSTRIYTETGCQAGVLTIEQGKIADFAPGGTDPEAVDYGDLRIIPGIFDTHNHGTCGYGAGSRRESLEDNMADIRGFLKGAASQGVTNVFPTQLKPAGIAAAAAVLEEGPQEGARILGIHSEGPWLNRVGEKGVRGACPPVTLDAARAMVDMGRGHLRLVALAPELPGMEAVIDFFLSRGVTVAAAHSDNQYRAAMAAYDRGVSVATHTGNVMTGLHHRDVGGLGAALLHPGVDCEVICDGVHICDEMLGIYFKLKSTDRFLMVSDCVHLSGAPAGRYLGIFPGTTAVVTEEGFLLTDTGRIMGSSQSVLHDIGHLVEGLGLPLETCLEMACLNPARKYGFAGETGSITVGKDADLVVISEDYQALETFSQGRRVYCREEEGEIFNPSCLAEERL